MLKRHIGLLFVLSVISLNLTAQKSISGYVKEEKNGRPIGNATVVLTPKGQQQVLAFTQTRENGYYELKAGNLPDSVTVSVRSMNILSRSKTIDTRQILQLDFEVSMKTTALKEVIVKAPKIRQKGDTLTYSVVQFADATDRTIADVLKKMPGIQVTPSGQILYQNKAISKFYIEGLDLLEGKYGLATNNLEADKVANVEVLENHQPVKLLKGIEIPESAAINLKLKKSALGAFFATAQAGIGASPLLLSNELVGMRFSVKAQNLMAYKGDNSGRDVSEELISHYGGSLQDKFSLLRIYSPVPPDINRQHYFFNDAHFGSFNNLNLLHKNFTVNTNISYLHDREKRKSYNRQELFADPVNPVVIIEDMQSAMKKRELEGSVKIENNQDNFLLYNKLELTADRNEHDGTTGNKQYHEQNLQTPSFRLGNTFEYTKKSRHNHRYAIKSIITYNQKEETLGVTPPLQQLLPDIDHKTIEQRMHYSHLSTDHSVSGYIDRGISAGITGGVATDHYKMNSGLYGDDNHLEIDSLRNDLRRDDITLKLSTHFSCKISENLKPQITVPLQYKMIYSHRHLSREKTNEGFFLFAPTMNIHYNFNMSWSVFSLLSFTKSTGSFGLDFPGYIMTSYRTLYRNDIFGGTTYGGSGFLSLSYKNIFSHLFANLRITYSLRRLQYLTDVYYKGIFSNTRLVRHPHNNERLGIYFSIGDHVDAIDSDIRLNAGYNNNKSVNLFQSVIKPFKLHHWHIEPSITSNIGKFMVAKYSCELTQTRSSIAGIERPVSNRWTQYVGLSFIPIKKLILNASANHYLTTQNGNKRHHAVFGNLSAQYKIRDIELRLDWTNIFNTGKYIHQSFSDISAYYSEYHLRPSEVMLRARFKLF